MWLGWQGLMCGWDWEKEGLRVPSTRSWGIVGEFSKAPCVSWSVERGSDETHCQAANGGPRHPTRIELVENGCWAKSISPDRSASLYGRRKGILTEQLLDT
jgi:hypothetical protein